VRFGSVDDRRLIRDRHRTADDRNLQELAELCGHVQPALRVAARRLTKSPVLTVGELGDARGVIASRLLGPAVEEDERPVEELRTQLSDPDR
jgi:hypothetical protein